MREDEIVASADEANRGVDLLVHFITSGRCSEGVTERHRWTSRAGVERKGGYLQAGRNQDGDGHLLDSMRAKHRWA